MGNKPVNIDRVLEKIAKAYSLAPLLWDERNETFVESVCNYYEKYDKLSVRQISALERIAEHIRQQGRKSLPKYTPEPEKPGYLNLNCRTGTVVWYSWQEFENK